jgi:hypothetical protein
MVRTMLVLGALIASPALAQFQSMVPSKSTDPFAAPGDPHFALYADSPSPLPAIVAEYAAANRAGRLASVGHRYFYDLSAHLYFGYDLVIEPEESVDSYRVAFSDLSIGPLDFQTDSPDSLNASLWKHLPLPALPAARLVRAGDPLSISVFRDAASGRSLIDTMTIVPMPMMAGGGHPGTNREMWQWAHSSMQAGSALSVRRASDVFGAARSFSAADAEMRLQMHHVSINGKVDRDVDATRIANGSLVWFYAPGHGRYILSLTPRPDLGFVQAGEIRGGLVTFSVDQDNIAMESPTMVAPGDAAYVLYVLHDANWSPTARGQMRIFLVGSVSARELAAVAK